MGIMLFHHGAVLEVMPHCGYVSSQLSSTSLHSETALSEKEAQHYFQVCQNSYLEHGRLSQ